MTFKNLFKTIKVFAIGVIIGETIVSYYKDEKFRDSFNNAKGFDKCKVLFNNLLEVNKKLFEEVKEVDYKKIVNNYKELLDSKVSDLWEKITELKTEVSKLHEEKLKPVIDELSYKYNELQEAVLSKKDVLVEDYQEKIKFLENKVNEVKNQIKKKFSK